MLFGMQRASQGYKGFQEQLASETVDEQPNCIACPPLHLSWKLWKACIYEFDDKYLESDKGKQTLCMITPCLPGFAFWV